MFKDFKLKINNFGPINNADLDIGKINVIAGKNSSGKTTISKLLYCIITSFSTDGENLTYESMKDQLISLINNIQIPYSESTINDLEKIRMNLELDKNYNLSTIEQSYNSLESIINSLDLDDKKFFLNSIGKNKIRLKNIRKMGFCWPLLINLIRNEFSGDEQLINNFNESEIKFYNDDENNPYGYIIKIDNGMGVKPETIYQKTITTNREAIYIETPYFLDYKIPFLQFERLGKKQHHQRLLYQKLADQTAKNDILDNIHNENIIKFQHKINKLINGKFKFNSQGLVEFNQNEKIFDLNNTSTGLKSIGIIQLLLENRKLKENTYLIMDEPEVHLHPEWQIKLAELLVSLSYELNIILFINSHSPLFIEAIRTYSEKYDILNSTNFYLTYNSKDTEGKYDIKNVPIEDLNIIYSSLGQPYETLSEISIENQFK